MTSYPPSSLFLPEAWLPDWVGLWWPWWFQQLQLLSGEYMCLENNNLGLGVLGWLIGSTSAFHPCGPGSIPDWRSDTNTISEKGLSSPVRATLHPWVGTLSWTPIFPIFTNPIQVTCYTKWNSINKGKTHRRGEERIREEDALWIPYKTLIRYSITESLNNSTIIVEYSNWLSSNNCLYSLKQTKPYPLEATT